MVEGRAAKQQRLHPRPAPAGEDSSAADEAAAAGNDAEAPAACPVSLQMVEEYEVGTGTATTAMNCQRFWIPLVMGVLLRENQ